MYGTEANIWMNEAASYNSASLGAYPAFLSPAEAARVERIRQARLLFDGKHRQYFLEEGRTQFSFRRVRTSNGIRPLYLTDNCFRLVSIKAADLLFGQAPIIKSDADVHAEMLARLADRSGLHQALHAASCDASAEGEAFFEALIYDGQVYVQPVDAATVFPVGPVKPDRQHVAYVRREIEKTGPESHPIWLLLESTYRRGSIERRLYQLDSGMRKMPGELSLDQWPGYAERPGTAALPVVQTGIPWNTMVWIPNLLIRGAACSDYDGVIELQDALNAKVSQLAVVILKHSDPKLLLPAESFNEQGQAPAEGEAYPIRQGDLEPKYVTWDAQLAAAQEDRKFALNQILVQTETSPVLLGLKEGAAPDAYRKVRLEAFNSVTKAARRSVYWTEGLRNLLMAASMLEQTIQGNRYDIGKISVQLRDGIPADAGERANQLATERGAGLCSVKRGLREILDGDDAAVETETEELNQERAAATPPMLLQTESDGATERRSDEGDVAAV